MGGSVDPDRRRCDDEERLPADNGSSADRKSAGEDRFADLGLDQAALKAVCEAVHARIFAAFRGSVNEYDIEDATSAALEALLNEHLETSVGDLRAFTTTVAYRAAVDLKRRQRAMPFDPLDASALEREDHTASPIERIDDRAQVARIAEALEQLEDDKLVAFHLRVIEDLPHDEACERLGIGRSAYFERVRAAKALVEGAVKLTSHVFERRQRQLLSDYVAGIAVGRARLRAERLITADPRAAALARELRRTHDAAAAVLPTVGFSVAVEQDAGGRLSALIDRVRDLASGWHRAGPDAGDLASSPALAAGGARGAGAAGAGLLAKAFGGLGAGNVALGCLGSGAVATIACVATGVLPLPGQGGDREHTRAQESEKRSAGAERMASQLRSPDLVASEPAAPTPQRPDEGPVAGDRDEPSEPAPAPAPESTLEPSVAPEVQEFGVAGAGTPVGGAPPDRNEANGASASSVRQEFGP